MTRESAERALDAALGRVPESRAKTGATESFVYVAHDTATFLYKIGVSTNPASRMDSLRTGNPRIALVATMPGGFATEKVLHAAFAPTRHRGEWFVRSPLLMRFVAEWSVRKP